MIAILKYGSGNVAAIANIYSKLNLNFKTVTEEAELEYASKLILPGVGAFDEAMRLFTESGLREPTSKLVLEKQIPVLGVCVGMQMMANSSAEGQLDGLGWVDAEVVRLDTSGLERKPLLPHMGWNSILPTKSHPILKGIDFARGFYFLHSFHIKCSEKNDVLTESRYGETFASSFAYKNVFGFQFHPEKSHANGIRLFKNFAEL